MSLPTKISSLAPVGNRTSGGRDRGAKRDVRKRERSRKPGRGLADPCEKADETRGERAKKDNEGSTQASAWVKRNRSLCSSSFNSLHIPVRTTMPTGLGRLFRSQSHGKAELLQTTGMMVLQTGGIQFVKVVSTQLSVRFLGP